MQTPPARRRRATAPSAHNPARVDTPDWTAPSPWRDPAHQPPARESLPVVVGISGASGALLARSTLRRLLARGERVECVLSRAAHEVWEQELGEPLRDGLRALAGE